MSTAAGMTPGLRVEVEIDLSGHALVVEFGQKGRDEPQTGIGIREDAGPPGAATQFPVDALQAIGGAQRHPMGGWEGGHRQALGHCFFGPRGELGGGLRQASKAAVSSRSASALSGALKMARSFAATGFLAS